MVSSSAGQVLNFLSTEWRWGSAVEELLAYAVLLGEGFEIGERYERRLDELFLASLEDRDLLELELLSGNWKASGIYIRSHVDYSALDRRRFGGALMEVLKPVYESMEVQEFASRAFQVWEGLPGNLQGEEPFWALSLGDYPGAREVERYMRGVYRWMLHYYDPCVSM